jgi:hypothetical protein
MGRPLGRWARDEDGARTGLPFMLWCVRSYIENPEGQYYSTKSRYCNTPPRVQALGSVEEEEQEEEEHLELVM